MEKSDILTPGITKNLLNIQYQLPVTNTLFIDLIQLKLVTLEYLLE